MSSLSFFSSGIEGGLFLSGRGPAVANRYRLIITKYLQPRRLSARARLVSVKTDKLFYRLFAAQPALLLDLAGIAGPYPPGYRQQALELKETGFRLDGLLRPPSADWPYVFWEAQFQPDVGFYARWMASLFVCLQQQAIDRWRSVVVFPSRAVDIGRTAAYEALLEHGLIQRGTDPRRRWGLADGLVATDGRPGGTGTRIGPPVDRPGPRGCVTQPATDSRLGRDDPGL
jgi:hypothetical protein